MQVKYKKAKKLSRHFHNISTLEQKQNPQQRFENAKRQLQKFSSQQQFHQKVTYENQIRIDEWSPLVKQKQQISQSISKKNIRKSRIFEKHRQSKIDNVRKLRIKNQPYHSKQLFSKKKNSDINQDNQRANLSFKTIRQIDGNYSFRKTIRKSNEGKESFKRLLLKTPLQGRQKFKRQSTMNETSFSKHQRQTFCLQPHEKKFIFGNKFNFISLDPDILDQGIKKSQEKVQSRKLKQKYLKGKKYGFLTQKINQKLLQKSLSPHKIINGHNFNQSQLFLKMGMLKPQISKLMQLIRKQDNNKIKFNFQNHKKKIK